MKFQSVVDCFERLETESKRLKITEILAELLKKATSTEAAIISYLALGQLHPTYIGTQFNFAEKSILKALATLLQTSQEHIKKQMDALGDLGSVVQTGTWQGSSDILSVKDVHKSLDVLAELSGVGSQDQKEEHIVKLLRTMTPLSAKYIIRIVQGTLRLGFSDMTLLDAFSWMETGDKSIRAILEDAYNISADIGLMVKTLKESGVKALENMTITPGIPIRPAAAERLADAQAIIEKIGPCVAQPKLDGFRLQVHINKTQKKPSLHFFSRNLQDMSVMFPDLVHAVLDLDVDTLVAEGEAIAFDMQTGSFLPFQETVKRKRKHDIEKMAHTYPLKLYFFDLLYFNGVSYLDKPHHERREKLEALLAKKTIQQHETLFLIQQKPMKNAQGLEAYFNATITQGLEGLVVKRPDAPYRPGKRNFNWIKLKRQESGSLDDTIDCVILGYYFGQGKRAAFGIGAFLVGVYDEKTDCFYTVAKVGTGLTDIEWKDLKKTCDALVREHKPSNVVCSKELYPDVWCYPETVVLVRADEITLSPLHNAGKTEEKLGLALRFPRIMGYRPDKKAIEATTVKEITSMFHLQFKKK